MSVTLNVYHEQQISAYTLNDSRVKRMLSGDYDTAVYMGLWDRFKDLFRHDKKAEILENLWKLIHPEEQSSTDKSENKLSGALHEEDERKYTTSLRAFRELQKLASGDEAQKALKWSVTTEANDCLQVSFRLKDVVIAQQTIPLVDTMSGADLRGTDLSGADLSGASLSGADLRSADLSGADLSYASLSDANLCGANLSNADLSNADLSGANLSGADLDGADLSGADLSYASLSDANLSNAEVSNADVLGAIMDRIITKGVVGILGKQN